VLVCGIAFLPSHSCLNILHLYLFSLLNFLLSLSFLTLPLSLRFPVFHRTISSLSLSLSPNQSLPSSSRPFRDQKDTYDPPLASSSNPDFLPGTLIPYDMYRRYRGLLEQKRELKRELKAYDEQFSRDYGRIPKKTDKEVRVCVVWCVVFVGVKRFFLFTWPRCISYC
jgi:hypothetical protein